ncbi:MAG: ABC transporter permease [Anaerolineae bacterium]|nr:ABC transporter permease [Anaerolineae bacterium]
MRRSGEVWVSLKVWLNAWTAMSLKELTIMTRYPLEFVASFGQVFLVITIMTLASSMFVPADIPAKYVSLGGGLVMYGFIIFIFLNETLWTIGYNIRREQKQGTLEQLYLSPASKSASLVSRVTVTLVWTGLLSLASFWLVSVIAGRVPVHNLPLGLLILVLSLSGMFGVGFAFAALTLRVRETAQTIANFLQISFIILCAPFFPFSVLPTGVQIISRLLPLSYSVDALRSTLLNYPPGFPELAPMEVELVIVIVFGLLMPWLGFWLYRCEEDRARRSGSLSEY